MEDRNISKDGSILVRTSLAVALVAVSAWLAWRLLKWRECAPSGLVVEEAQEVSQESPPSAADAGGPDAWGGFTEFDAALPMPVVSAKNPRVVEYERMVAFFERDAAAFRAEYPVYEEFLRFVRQTLAPMYLEGKRADLAIHKAFGVPLGYFDPTGATLSAYELKVALRREACRQYGRDLWDQTRYRIRGELLAKYLFEFAHMAESGIVFMDDAELEALRHRARKFDQQRREAVESNWPAIEDLIPDKESLHYKLFIADLGDTILRKFFVLEAAALPAGLEKRRKDIERMRRELIDKGLIEGPTHEYFDAYHRALLDELDRADEFTRLSEDARRDLRNMKVIDLPSEIGGLEDD